MELTTSRHVSTYIEICFITVVDVYVSYCLHYMSLGTSSKPQATMARDWLISDQQHTRGRDPKYDIICLTNYSFSLLSLSLAFWTCSKWRTPPVSGGNQGGHFSGKPGRVKELKSGQAKVRENELLQLFSCREYCSDRNTLLYTYLYYPIGVYWIM